MTVKVEPLAPARPLSELEAELAAERELLVRYSRMTTALELQLEKLDVEHQRSYRRAQQLAAEIETLQVLAAIPRPTASSERRAARSR